MWQKESKGKNALYINLCAVNGLGKTLDGIYKDVRSEINAHKKMHTLSQKSNQTSQQKRRSAKLHFDERDWETAIDLYNESLCFAENGSSDLGLSYANRSACFFNMRMYAECLIDIDLAIENNCPKNLHDTLIARKNACKKNISNGLQVKQRELTLDFPADEKFPGISKAIAIEKDGKGNPMVVAKQNIDVGQIIAIDKGFMKTLFTIYGWKCNICLKSKTNLVPCKKCTTAMFCHGCEHNNLHQYECGMKTSLYSNYNNYLMQELRTFFIALDLFSTADEMMNFVEQSIGHGQTEVPESLQDDRSRYRTYLKMVFNSPEAKDVQFAPIVFCLYKILLEIPKVNMHIFKKKKTVFLLLISYFQVKVMFESKRHRRFLMHIIGHHVQINIRQTFLFVKDTVDNRGKEVHQTLYSQVGLLLSYINHACSPNVTPLDHDGDTVYMAVRPIDRGQEVVISNYSFHWNLSIKFREILCCCERCEQKFPSQFEVLTLANDPNFQFISANFISSEFDPITRNTFDVLKDKCIKLLKRYGRMLWCEQFGIVLHIFTSLAKADLHNAIEETDDKINNN